MSTYAFPDLMKPDAMINAMPDMTGWTKGFASMPVSPLMVHPLAASAALTALGVAAAGQVMGMMMGSIEGAIDASSRLGVVPAGFAMGELTAPVPKSEAKRVSPATARKAAPVLRTVPKADVSTPVAKATATVSKGGAKKPADAVSGLKAVADAAADAVMEAESKPAPKEVAAPEEPKGALAPEEFVRPDEMAKPERPDDLKRISGIGPKLEEVLNRLGIWTFAQIAVLKPAEVAWLDDYLQFKGRIERDAWQEQAAKLAPAAK